MTDREECPRCGKVRNLVLYYPYAHLRISEKWCELCIVEDQILNAQRWRDRLPELRKLRDDVRVKLLVEDALEDTIKRS